MTDLIVDVNNSRWVLKTNRILRISDMDQRNVTSISTSFFLILEKDLIEVLGFV